MLKSVRHFFGLDEEDDELKRAVKQARGNLTNAVTNLSAQARVLERQDPFEAFVNAMRERPGDGHDDHH